MECGIEVQRTYLEVRHILPSLVELSLVSVLCLIRDS